MPERTRRSRVAGTPSATKKPQKSIELNGSNASVTYRISITKNLGDYNSLKIEGGITVPYGASASDLKELDKLMITSKELVVKRLEKDLADISADI